LDCGVHFNDLGGVDKMRLYKVVAVCPECGVRFIGETEHPEDVIAECYDCGILRPLEFSGPPIDLYDYLFSRRGWDGKFFGVGLAG